MKRSFKLTDKEREVANLLIRGKTNSDIAIEMGVKLVTIKTHMTQIMKKIGTTNRTGAALRIQERGYKRIIKKLQDKLNEERNTNHETL